MPQIFFFWGVGGGGCRHSIINSFCRHKQSWNSVTRIFVAASFCTFLLLMTTAHVHVCYYLLRSVSVLFCVSWITNTCDVTVICNWPKKPYALSRSLTSVILCSTFVLGFISLEYPSFSILHGLPILLFFDVYLVWTFIINDIICSSSRVIESHGHISLWSRLMIRASFKKNGALGKPSPLLPPSPLNKSV